MKSLALDWPDVPSVSEVDLAVGEFDPQTATRLECCLARAVDVPPEGFGVLDDDWCSWSNVLDGA